MAHAITIDAAASGLNQFVQRFGNRINQTLQQELEFERMLPFVDTEYAYTGQDVTIGSILQPYQTQFTPNNSETYDGITSFLKPVKVDLEFSADQLEKFFAKWRANWFTPNPDDTQRGYADYIINNHILPTVAEDLNNASWAGEYSAPTPGTAGAVLESVDGYKKAIADQVTAGRLTPITTGALVENTMVAQVRDFIKDIPEPYRYRSGKIIMSKSNVQKYSDNYRATYSYGAGVEKEPNQVYVDVPDLNKMLVGVTAMEGSDRMICVFDNLESMIIGTRTGFPRYFNFRFEPEDRKLKVFAEIYRFYSFETCLHMFVNEQV